VKCPVKWTTLPVKMKTSITLRSTGPFIIDAK